MAKKSDPPTTRQCPHCRATRFQGPFRRGEFQDNDFVELETLYQCVGCHAVLPYDRLLVVEKATWNYPVTDTAGGVSPPEEEPDEEVDDEAD